MKIRNRLTMISSLIFGVFFTISSLFVYVTYYRSSEQVIFNELERACLLTAFFYLEEDELPYEEHQIIRNRFEEKLANIEVRVYNEVNQIRYGIQVPEKNITPAILDQVREEKRLHFKADGYYYSSIFYPDNQGDFVVFLKEENEFFVAQSNFLLITILIVLFIGILAIIFLSRALSNIAYRPISNVIEQVNEMESGSLHRPLQTPKSNDEIQEMVETFNNLLNRLSETFIIQKNFINYVSHEIKTPLAAISGSLEVFAQKDRSPEEYESVAKNALKNTHEINDIINTMMMVSGLKKEEVAAQEFRLDELLWEIIGKVQIQYPERQIKVQIKIPPEKTKLLTIQADRIQLFMAIFNLIENAVKYSHPKDVNVTLFEKSNRPAIEIKDFGKGIPEDEINNVTKPFYRCSNVQDIKGSGIGLSVADIIFKNNEIDFNIDSTLNSGTTIVLHFPKL
jgi:two-component system, OmpR family, sensor histidine kinase ArlS